MKVLLITGGDSSERTVSLTSAKTVKKGLVKNHHKVGVYDLRGGYKKIEEISKNYDVLFPILHGEEGEGGKLHKFLNKINKPIVGTRNYKGLEQAWDKINFKKYCDNYKIKTSPWKIVSKTKDAEVFGFPSVLKASNGGSSREVMILKNEVDLHKTQAVKIVSSRRALVEKYLPGIEVTSGVLEDKALPLLEIKPTKDTWFSYKTKYDNTTLEIPFAPSLNPEISEKVKRIALKIHRHFNLGTYSRTDFIVHKNEIFALEVNTIPGLTPGSLLPKAAAANGINFNEFLEILIKNAK